MRMRRTGLTAGVLALALAGCSAMGGKASSASDDDTEQTLAPSLAGTSWQLVAFESADDAQGTKRPAPDHTVSITFAEDGAFAAKLDCNRGSGSWQAQMTGAAGGSLAITPLATTRAFCLEPSLGEMVAAALPDVASYTMRDGKLYLALKMDGGIFAFAPLPDE
ncbi:META domain-containing protein [Novosphingobium sp. PC22D]|uniref:META domain-containing protein n=1 Tax=Novosphingobium sp. PC22D TaxID=1962403 RepID=UPI00143C2CB0|nr:META domain-containing protein [Novosphingobium sp. PC22D]